MHILMPLSNAYKPDPRVAREAHALARHDYQVSVLCWDRQGELPAQESHNGVEVIRIQSVRSAHGAGWRQLFHLPCFWQAVIRQGVALHPDVVHCHDLDTLYIGWRLKSKLNCPLIYDAHENYAAVMSLYLPKILVVGLVYWERWLLRHVDATITASTILRDELVSRGFSPTITLGNYQDIGSYLNITNTEAQAVRTKLGVRPDELLIIYIGGLTRDRVILPLIEAVAHLPHIQCHIWGDGQQRVAVEQAVTHIPNAHYHGWLASAELPRHFKAADIVYYCLKANYPGAIYNAPNTLGQAMAAGRPIIANDVGDLGRIVRATQCGVVIDETTPQAIANAIRHLQPTETRAQIGAKALHAAQNIYNANAVEHELVELYKGI